MLLCFLYNSPSFKIFISLKKKFSIYLAVLGFSSDMWDLVSWPGIKPRSPTLGAQSLIHWTTRTSLYCCEATKTQCNFFLLLYSVVLSFPSVSTLFLVALYRPHLFWVYFFPVFLSVHILSPIIVSSSLSRILVFLLFVFQRCNYFIKIS